MDTARINEQFLKAYHSSQPGIEIREFLVVQFPNNPSRHLDALRRFCEVVERNPDAPGMIYGMIWEAFKMFLEELDKNKEHDYGN